LKWGSDEQPGGALTAADAHGHDHELGAPTPAFDERVTDEACAAHTVRMTHRNRAAVDVQTIVRDAEPVAAIEHLAGESLVKFPQIDVAHRVAGAFQQPRHRMDRTDAHLIGFTAGDGKSAKYAERSEPAPFGELGVHDHTGAAAVGELAGVPCRDDAARHRGPDLGDALERGIRTDAFIPIDGDLAHDDGAGGLVDGTHDRLHRYDLVVELPLRLCGGRPQLAANTVLILGLLGDVVALGHGLGGLQHRPVQRRLVLENPGVGPHVRIGFVLHAGNALESAGDHDRYALGHDALGGQGDGLQSRAAEAVDAQAGGRHGKPGAKRNRSSDVAARSPLAEGRAHDHVLDFGRIYAGACHRMLHGVGAQSGAIGHIECALPALAEAGTCRGHDDGPGHDADPLYSVKVLPSWARRASNGAGVQNATSAPGDEAMRRKARSTSIKPVWSA
jgi:hypothetical protein